MKEKHNVKARLRESIELLRDATNEFLSDNCPHLAASISYYLLLSIFPLTLGLISILGFFSISQGSETKLVEAIGDFLPISSDYITGSLEDFTRSQSAIGIVSTIILLWSGSSLFNAIRKSLNTAWGVRKSRPFHIERGMDLLMMLGALVLLMVSFSITTGLQMENGDILWGSILVFLTFVLSFLTFLLLYKFIPNTDIRWKDVWAGALLAAVLYELVKQGFIWYATNPENSGRYTSVYGSIGTLIVLLVWTYISAMIMLFCAKLTAVHSRRKIFREEDLALRVEKSGESKGEPYYFQSQLSVNPEPGPLTNAPLKPSSKTSLNDN